MNEAAIALLAVTLATFLNSSGMVLFKLAHLKAERTQCNYLFTW